MIKSYYVYIMTNKYNTVLYTGVTNDLERRVFQHKTKAFKGFTSKYNCRNWFITQKLMILVWLLPKKKESRVVQEKRRLY